MFKVMNNSLKAQCHMYEYLRPRVTFRHYAFVPQGATMLLSSSEQIAIVSLHCNYQLVSTMETKCVLFEGGTEILSTFQLNTVLIKVEIKQERKVRDM